MIVSVDVEKALDKIWYPVMIRTLKKIWFKENILQHNKGYMRQIHNKYNSIVKG